MLKFFIINFLLLINISAETTAEISEYYSKLSKPAVSSTPHIDFIESRDLSLIPLKKPKISMQQFKRKTLREIESQQKLKISKIDSSNFEPVYLSCTLTKTKEKNNPWKNISLRQAKTNKSVNIFLTFLETECIGDVDLLGCGHYLKTINHYTVYGRDGYFVYLSKNNKYVNLINAASREAKQYTCKPRDKSIIERAEELKNKWF